MKYIRIKKVINKENSPKLVTINNISKAFSNTKILENVSLTVKTGEIVTIIGRSGIGKTTLLKLIAGLLVPDTGQVLIDNESPTSVLKSNKIGFVFQRQLLFDWMNLEENIMLPIKIMKGKITSYEDLSVQLNLFRLTEHRNKYPNQVSGGIYQRATVARALIYNPKILLLDEPFNSLDDFTKDQLLRELREIWKSKGITVILVTHAIREAYLLSDRIIVLSSRKGFNESNNFNIDHNMDIQSQYLINYDQIVKSMENEDN